jgi:predicted small secreted protein
MTKKLLLALAAAGLCLGAGGCNTVKGFGKDVQSVGQAGSDAIHH